MEAGEENVNVEEEVEAEAREETKEVVEEVISGAAGDGEWVEEEDEDGKRPLKRRLIHSYTADRAVELMLKGLAAAFPSLTVDPISRIVFLNRYRKNRVGLLSGGGSGHEPFAAGYVGECMLTCAVGGSIFTSPTSAAILTAIKNVALRNKGGVLVIVMNYTGDVINFGLAVEEARSRGYEVDSVVLGEDASGADAHSIAGKRGLCGSVLAFKIAGALSTAGRPLSEIALTVHAVTLRLATVGVCLEACSLPGRAPMFQLPRGRLQLGVGIHGEAGVLSIQMGKPAEVVSQVVEKIADSLQVSESSVVVVLVNNLGGLTALELALITSLTHDKFAELGVEVARVYSGTCMTSLDMNGFHVSCLDVTGRREWLALLDLETEAFAWPGTRLSSPPPISTEPTSYETELVVDDLPEEAPSNSIELTPRGQTLMRECLEAASRALIAEEQKLNQLDSGAGDGDTGSTFARLANRVLKDSAGLPVRRLGDTLLALRRMAEEEMGGTSGGLYALMLMGAARNSHDWAAMWTGGLDLLQQYTAARLGYRTMLDALLPAANAFSHVMREQGSVAWRNALRLAVEKAAKGCDSTRDMRAKAGRASYVDMEFATGPDPGAFAVVTWLSAIYKHLISSPLAAS